MKFESIIKQEADRCVMCGLCLPHCPTYIETRNEAESPRGRISLIQGLANNKLDLTPTLRAHLDSCLLCRACENKCPSGVRFGKMMDGARVTITEQHPKTSTQKVLFTELATNKQRRQRDTKLMWLAESSGLRKLGKNLGITKALGLERLEQLTPSIKRPKKWQDYYPAKSEKQGDVALFSGCFSDMLDQKTLIDAVTLLNHCGYGVHVPNTQTCCGALHLHQGDAKQARTLAQQNQHAFESLNIDAIISTASGCGSHLKEYDKQPDISQQVVDISAFLAQIKWPESIKLQPLNKRVAVHEPCSLRNVLKQAQAPYELLKRIPKLDVVALPDNERCCGAAGNYMIEHPEMADQLRSYKIDALERLKADTFVTSNIGCAMHLQAGIRQAKLNINVIHPITLLAQQLA